MWIQLLIQEHLLVEQVVEEGVALLLDALDIHEVQEFRELITVHMQLLADVKVVVVFKVQVILFDDMLKEPTKNRHCRYMSDGLYNFIAKIKNTLIIKMVNLLSVIGRGQFSSSSSVMGWIRVFNWVNSFFFFEF